MKPANSFVNPLLTDLYQITMAYAYWQSGHHEDQAAFDLFFRKNPFDGEFTIFAGLEEVLRFVNDFRFSEDDIEYLRHGVIFRTEELQYNFEVELLHGVIRQTAHGYERNDGHGDWLSVNYPDGEAYVEPLLPGCDPAFFDWLRQVDCSKIKIYAIREGTFVFPSLPLIRVEGPLAIAQLLETTLLALVNYPCLVATNAARFRIAAGANKTLLEFGLRRAQGPDGGVSAARYCYMGGFDATSNVLAGRLFGVPVRGTHAHSFVSAFANLGDIKHRTTKGTDGREHDLAALTLAVRDQLKYNNTNDGELAAFISYGQSFPQKFLALVDTYDTLKSGVPNFICVAVALHQLGYQPLGIRLDSGDLAYLSKEARKKFLEAGKICQVDMHGLTIVASNEINEQTLEALNQQGHEINTFGIGTHLVTCQRQPALGGVYKLVEINGKHRIKLSQEKAKMTIPGRKEAYRLIGQSGYPLLDLMIIAGEEPPQIGKPSLCRHPFEAAKRAYATPSNVIPLHTCVWDGYFTEPLPSLSQIRQYVMEQLNSWRPDHLRPLNPTPYKVSVSDALYNFLHDLWLEESPIDRLE